MKKLFLVEIFKALSKKQKDLLSIAVIILLTFLISYKVIYRRAVRKTAYYNNNYQECLIRNKLREELTMLDSLRKDYESLIAQKEDIDGIRNELSKLALKSGVKVVSVSSAGRRTGGGYNVLSTAMELEGNYHQIGNFIARIENARPYIGIGSIKLGVQETQLAGRRAATTTTFDPEAEAPSRVNLLIETYSSGE